ncbi:MAG: HU family DNA-binding protein [Oscillospiraceae bacterium]|jgi:DNA-binding protein HU-beta|nr:HU family DNA-binding protein [Oscillospiraceae bacterium]
MNKQELVTAIASAQGIEKREAEKYLSATLDALTSALVAGEKIQLIGFGSFEVVDRPERTVRNPRTGEPIVSPAQKTPKFKPGKALKDAVTGK